MPFYADIDNSYLDAAVSRLQTMLALASAPDPVQVFTYVDPNKTPPFWWMYPGVVPNTPLAWEIEKQVYEVVARYVVDYTTEGYDGNAANRIWTILPQTINYINGHKRLIFDNPDPAGPILEPIDYLDFNGVRARQSTSFGQFNNFNQLGVEISITLPFTVQIEQEF